MNTLLRCTTLLAMVCSLQIIAGCAPVQPWVKPYERDKLADPLMVQAPFPLDDGYMNHMYRSREGARGAEGAGGGGCGCN